MASVTSDALPDETELEPWRLPLRASLRCFLMFFWMCLAIAARTEDLISKLRLRFKAELDEREKKGLA